MWHDLRGADRPAVVAAQAPRLQRVLDAARDAGVSAMVIDTAPHASDAALAAARAADIALMPCRCAIPDLHAIGATLDVCRPAGVPAAVVLNAAPVQGKLAQQAREAMAQHGAEVAPMVLHQRIAHVHAFTRGLTAVEYEPTGKAAAELTALYRWTVDSR